MSRADLGVGVQFPDCLRVVLKSVQVHSHIFVCFKVGVFVTLFDTVAELLATQALLQLLLPLDLFFSLIRIANEVFILSVLAGLVLSELATRCIFACLAAAPPHLSAPLGLVHSATPVKVFLFVEFLLAVLTLFQAFDKLASPLPQFLQRFPYLLFLFLFKLFVFVHLKHLLSHFLQFFLLLLHFLLIPLHFFLERVDRRRVLHLFPDFQRG